MNVNKAESWEDALTQAKINLGSIITAEDWSLLKVGESFEHIRDAVNTRIAELDKLADVELRLECCRDASNGKDLLITALEKRIADLEYQAFQFAMRSERSPKAYVEKCDDGSFNVCFGVFQRKYAPVKSRLKEMK